jgi:predicted SAM-dependent methyltransferase
MRLLNLGCGLRFHPDWTNVDLNSCNSCVKVHDLRQGIPYQNCTFDVVYHSHLIEHFSKQEALGFLNECFRVLKHYGIIRVVVPDLERIVQMYLHALEKSLQGNSEWQLNYEWIMLELYDQSVRSSPGGAMLEYLNRESIPNKVFIKQRIGAEAKKIFQKYQKINPEKKNDKGIVLRTIDSLRERAKLIHEITIRKLLGNSDYAALQIGRFRLKGEIHQWMYDNYSLDKLLKTAGFINPDKTKAFESAIPNWTQYNLDTEPDGSAYKPDSLYIEAIKPMQ